MAWVNPNATKTVGTSAWADETRAAITLVGGVVASNGMTGVTVNLPAAVASVDDYLVWKDWQEDEGPNSGRIIVIKGLSSFVLKNTGSTTGKKIGYRASMKVVLP